MTRETFMSLLPRYPDDMPDGAERNAFLLHAAEDPECAAALAEHEAMLANLATMDEDLDIPPEAAQGWRAAIREAAKPMRRPLPARWQGWAIAAVLLVVVIGGTSLMREGMLFPEALQATVQVASAPMSGGGAADTGTVARSMIAGEADAMPEMEVEVAFDMYMADDSGAQKAAGGDGAAIVLQTASVSLTSGTFDADVAQIEALLSRTGGWMAYRSISGTAPSAGDDRGRWASLDMRVPTHALDAFLSEVEAVGQLTGSDRSAEDISDRYQDTQGRLAMYKAQRDRLLALMEEAQDMEDILSIEARLSEVQYELESLQGRLNSWDSRANYASVQVWVEEAVPSQASPDLPFPQRLRLAVSSSLRAARGFLADALVFLIMAAPYLVCAVVVIAVVHAIWRGRRNHHKGEEKS